MHVCFSTFKTFYTLENERMMNGTFFFLTELGIIKGGPCPQTVISAGRMLGWI